MFALAWTRYGVVVAPTCEDPKLINHVINFELFQRICPRYLNVTDRRTDGRLTTAIPRFALGASRGKNECLSPTGAFFSCKARNIQLSFRVSDFSLAKASYATVVVVVVVAAAAAADDDDDDGDDAEEEECVVNDPHRSVY